MARRGGRGGKRVAGVPTFDNGQEYIVVRLGQVLPGRVEIQEGDEVIRPRNDMMSYGLGMILAQRAARAQVARLAEMFLEERNVRNPRRQGGGLKKKKRGGKRR